jgi:hypothetical protein
MNDTVINCPNCGSEIALAEVLTARLHAEFDAEYHARTNAAVAEAERRKQQELQPMLDTLQQQLKRLGGQAQEAEQRELDQRRRMLEMEQQQRTSLDRARLEIEERLHKEEEAKMQRLQAQTEQQVRQDVALEKKLLETRLAEEQQKTAAALTAEFELRQKADILEERQRNLDLEVARRLDSQKSTWEATLRTSFAEEHDLKLKEKEKQIADLGRLLGDARRKTEQGSQELQGEVFEIDIQSAIERQFLQDVIRPVPKGRHGADLIQEVRDVALQPCGSIIWEFKNTKHWQTSWIDKLKADQRDAGAAIAVLVSVTLPDGMRSFAQVNGVWVCNLSHYLALGTALRDQLIQVAFVRVAAHGKSEKMEMLYQYLAGDEFRHRVEGILDAFTMLRDQLDKERRAMNKHWAEREKQLEKVIHNTTGMYGSLQGIIGKGLPVIPALEFDYVPLLEEEG